MTRKTSGKYANIGKKEITLTRQKGVKREYESTEEGTDAIFEA
jgi:hypothetical protein